MGEKVARIDAERRVPLPLEVSRNAECSLSGIAAFGILRHRHQAFYVATRIGLGTDDGHRVALL